MNQAWLFGIYLLFTNFYKFLSKLHLYLKLWGKQFDDVKSLKWIKLNHEIDGKILQDTDICQEIFNQSEVALENKLFG